MFFQRKERLIITRVEEFGVLGRDIEWDNSTKLKFTMWEASFQEVPTKIIVQTLHFQWLSSMEGPSFATGTIV